MKRILPVEELARDTRFQRINIEEVVFDPRNAVRDDRSQRNAFKATDPDAPDASRQLMHSIFVGEIQASRARAARAGTSTPARAVTRHRSSSSSTWRASVGTSPATWRSR